MPDMVKITVRGIPSFRSFYVSILFVCFSHMWGFCVMRYLIAALFMCIPCWSSIHVCLLLGIVGCIRLYIRKGCRRWREIRESMCTMDAVMKGASLELNAPP